MCSVPPVKTRRERSGVDRMRRELRADTGLQVRYARLDIAWAGQFLFTEPIGDESKLLVIDAVHRFARLADHLVIERR